MRIRHWHQIHFIGLHSKQIFLGNKDIFCQINSDKHGSHQKSAQRRSDDWSVFWSQQWLHRSQSTIKGFEWESDKSDFWKPQNPRIDKAKWIKSALRAKSQESHIRHILNNRFHLTFTFKMQRKLGISSTLSRGFGCEELSNASLGSKVLFYFKWNNNDAGCSNFVRQAL